MGQVLVDRMNNTDTFTFKARRNPDPKLNPKL